MANVDPHILAMRRSGPGIVGTPVSFAADATDGGLDDALTFDWDFGDGGTGSGTQVRHSFRAPDRYTVILDVDDGDGGRDRRTLTVAVGGGGQLSVSGAVGIPCRI